MSWIDGYPRGKIDWSPRVDLERCVQCGMCMNCGKGVFEWHRDGPHVVHQDHCVVGCQTCANLCMGEAISFPDLGSLRDTYRKEEIWGRVKIELAAEGRLIRLKD